MSNVLVEATVIDTHPDVAPDSVRTVMPAPSELVAGPQSAFTSASAIRLSAELVAVLTHWMAHPRWRHGVSPALPGYRRILP
jgi:hypothetical protein